MCLKLFFRFSMLRWTGAHPYAYRHALAFTLARLKDLLPDPALTWRTWGLRKVWPEGVLTTLSSPTWAASSGTTSVV